jgi:hypothetical protein
MPKFVPMGISGSVLSRAASGNAQPRCAARNGPQRWSGWRSTVNAWRHHRYRDPRSVSSICTPESTVGGHVTNGAANTRYLYTRLEGPCCQDNVHRNTVYQSMSRWWRARKFLDGMWTGELCSRNGRGIVSKRRHLPHPIFRTSGLSVGMNNPVNAPSRGGTG